MNRPNTTHIRRLLQRLRRPRPRAQLCAVLTDFDTLELHAGDWIYVERTAHGFRVCAAILRDYELQRCALYFCPQLRYAENLRIELERALERGARQFQPRQLEAA